MSKRKANAVAKDLRSPKYRMRIEKPEKGKGSFKRIKKVDFKKEPHVSGSFHIQA